MTDRLPYEPVSGYWVDPEEPMEYRDAWWQWPPVYGMDPSKWLGDALRVGLANGQTIIVKAKPRKEGEG